jgi:hypothetical protein
MARFQVTMSTGEKLLVDHPATSMTDILAEVGSKAFLLLSEVMGGSSTPARDVIVASRQIALIRPLGDRTMQGTDFRPKR